jgi:integrase
MAKGSITKRAIDALKKGPTDQFLWSEDRPGFGVKHTPAGKKVFIIQYRMGGRACPTRRYTIGSYGRLTVAQADKEAAKLLLMVSTGTDPAAAKAERIERQRTDDALSFPEYVQRFLDLYVKREWAKSYSFAESILRLHVTPRLKDKNLPAIRKTHITAMLDAIPANAVALRRNVYSVTRRLFNWAEGRGDIATNPLNGFEAPSNVASRDRVLAGPELRLVWLGSADLGFPFRPFYRLLAGTGQRREEVSGIAWPELDRAAATWTLPGERTKNGAPHIVHLSPLMVAELDEIAKGEEWPRKGLVLSTNGKTPVSGYSRAKRRLDAAIVALAAEEADEAGDGAEPAEVAPWRIHDLRRTLATGLQKLGIRFEVTEACLNHLSGARAGVAGVYQRYDWANEKRDALNAWATQLELIVTGAQESNVVPIMAARAAE